MARLKDRNRQIPGGFRFALPEVGYTASPFQSFDTIVMAVTGLVKGNPQKAEEYGWPLERRLIADWIDNYNASVCEQNGWTEFYVPGGPTQFSAQIPYERWPLWAKTVAGLKIPADGGVGDTVERIIGSDNSEALKSWYKNTFKRLCGCDGRKTTWNILYKYDV